MIWRVVETSRFSSFPVYLMLLELELGAIRFSNMNLRICTDSSACVHRLERVLNWFWREVTLWRKKLTSTSCFSSNILTSVCIFASSIFWWALICSSSTWISVQWRQSSLWAILEVNADLRDGTKPVDNKDGQEWQECNLVRWVRGETNVTMEGRGADISREGRGITPKLDRGRSVKRAKKHNRAIMKKRVRKGRGTPKENDTGQKNLRVMLRG